MNFQQKRSRIKREPTCYACDAAQKGDEHAPPKSFFPLSQRTNLIQVPSCDLHNSAKSNDDQYTLVHFLGLQSNKSKDPSILERIRGVTSHQPKNNDRLRLFEEIQNEYEVDGNGLKCVKPDDKRIFSHLELMIKAVYYFETCTKIREDVEVQIRHPYIDVGDGIGNNKAYDAFGLDSHEGDYIETNPGNFKYKIIERPNYSFLEMVICNEIKVAGQWDGGNNLTAYHQKLSNTK